VDLPPQAAGLCPSRTEAQYRPGWQIGRHEALSEYYSYRTIVEQEAAYHDRAGSSITLSNAEKDSLVASLNFDNLERGES